MFKLITGDNQNKVITTVLDVKKFFCANQSGEQEKKQTFNLLPVKGELSIIL